MSISEAQHAANRANAQKSTGPTSLAGKQRSSQNARRHGITAQTTVMTEEDRIEHDDFCNKIMTDLAPVGPLETFLASSAAEEAWRMNYVRAQCENIIAIGHFDGTGETYTAEHPEVHTAMTSAQTSRDNAKTLQLLSLYEQRIHRAFQKHCAQLRQLQAERNAKRAADLDNARLLFQLAQLQHLPWNPSEDGFDFSKQEIHLYTEQFHRLQLANEQNKTYRKHANLYDLPKAA